MPARDGETDGGRGSVSPHAEANPAVVPSPAARDGETLSDERRIDELLREFQMACEDAAEFNADSIRASAKHRAILRNELRSELLAVAALRAEVAALRKEGKRCVTTFDRRADARQETDGNG